MINRKINYVAFFVMAALSAVLMAGCGTDGQVSQQSDIGVVVNSDTENAQLITLDEAKSAALSHAGLSADDVVFIKAKLEHDDRITEYDIEFTADNVKYEYEIDAGDGKILEFSSEIISENRNDIGTYSSTEALEQITIDEAKDISLKHAGVTYSEIVFTKAKLDYDDGTAEYDIEFIADNIEYEYEINAVNGSIISYTVKSGYETDTIGGEMTESSAEKIDQAATTVSSGQITLDEAKSIALKHAGVTESEAVFTKAKLDYDDGIAEYDIEFIANNVEYEYEIDADRGSILESSAEKAKQVMSTSVSELITVDEAKFTALEHAGFTADQVRFTKSELDYDDGIAEYEIEFKANGFEYEYKINASTGKIIEFDIDD